MTVYIFLISIFPTTPFPASPIFLCLFKKRQTSTKKTFSSQFSCGAVAGCSLMLSGETTTQIPFWRKKFHKVHYISLFMYWRNSVFDAVNNWAPKTKKKVYENYDRRIFGPVSSCANDDILCIFANVIKQSLVGFLLAEVFHNISKVVVCLWRT